MNQANDIRKAMAVFDEVCDLPPEERAAALDAHCQGDAELRKRVEQMLVSEDDEHALLAESKHGAGARIVSEHLSAASYEQQRPERIDRYKILREIGRGGMGVVFEAEQDSPRRRVALKLIHATAMSPSLIKRFEREAFALGKLQHPGIAHIYESGTTELNGRRQPFLAMELIDGERITEYVKNHALGIRSRLELIAQVCDAVQHAHQKGVIHRDLKPANILVTEQSTQGGTGGATAGGGIAIGVTGQPKILDFGVARLTDIDAHAVTLQTDPGQIVGTLAFMSPEQVVGDPKNVDARCDVYALGVVLFQVLTDRLPLDLTGKTVAEAARIIRDEEPASVVSIDRTLRGDVETIVAKALEKDPGRRYSSAAELAADIRRFLRDEPITARPASAVYNMRKFARRNKGLVGGLITAFVVLLLGAAGTTVGLVSALRANRELEETNVTLADTNRELEDTNRALEQSNTDLKNVSEFQSAQLTGIDVPAMGLHIRSDILMTLPEDERPSAETQLAAVNYTDVARSALSAYIFDRALSSIDEEFDDRPVLQARLLQDVATVLRQLGMLEQAVEPQRHALAIRRAELGDDSPDTVMSLKESGLLNQDLGNLDVAEAQYLEAWETNRRLRGEHDPATIDSHSNIAAIQQAKGDWDAAEASVRAVLADLTGLEHSDEASTLDAMSVLAGILFSKSEYKEAEQLMRDTLRGRRALFGDEHPSTLKSMTNLGGLLEAIGKYDEAKTLCEQALAVKRRLFGDDHPQTIWSNTQLANVLFAQGKLAEAEQIRRDALSKQRQLLGNNHTDTLISANNLAMVLDEMGRFTEAETYYREALTGFRKVFGEEHPNTLQTLGNVGFVLNRQGKPEEAEPYYREALAGFRKAFGTDNQLTLTATGNLAALLSDLGKTDEAEPLYYESLEGRRRHLGEDHPSTLNATYNMGYFLRSKGKLAEAEPLCVAALEGYQRIGGDNHIGTLYSLVQMGELRMQQERAADAESYFQIAVDRRREINGDDHPATLDAVHGLANAIEAQNHWSDAERWRRFLYDAAQRSEPADIVDIANRQADLGKNLLQQAKLSEAEAVLRESVSRYEQSTIPTDCQRWRAQSLLGEVIANDAERRVEAEGLLLEAAQQCTAPRDEDEIAGEQVTMIRNRLVNFYESTSQSEKAAEWREHPTEETSQ